MAGRGYPSRGPNRLSQKDAVSAEIFNKPEDCAWYSQNCVGVVELYTIRQRGSEREDLLCSFHGQAHQKVGESDKDFEKRTKRVRMSLTRKPDFGPVGHKRKEPLSEAQASWMGRLQT